MTDSPDKPELVQVPTGDDYAVPLQVFRPDGPVIGPTLLILPALGVSVRFYRTLARALRNQGIASVLFEQRGHGDSALRAGRNTDWGIGHWLLQDIPAATGWMREQWPGSEIVPLGHSLGGHVALNYVALHPQQHQRIILAATGTPWTGAFAGVQRWQVRFLVAAIPLLGGLCGYYPGQLLGFGGREARSLMMDWRELARHNRYAASGVTVEHIHDF